MTLLDGQTLMTTTTSAPQALDFVLFDSLAAAQTEWRALEARAVLTPYQRYDWLAALIASGLETNTGVVIVLIRSAGVGVALLPLVVERRFGIASARILGTAQSNCDWLITLPEFAPDATSLRTLFAKIGQTVGIDLLTLLDQPAIWQGKTNAVLALGQSPAASNLYVATIGPTPVPYIEHRLTTKRRSNIKRGARRLEELYGPVRAVRVNDVATLDAVHAAFLTQRGARFEEILATCWGAMAGDHYSQYINSTSAGPAAKYSLMAVLVAEVMDDLTQSGILTFDMGLGDFDYKVEWTEPQQVFHSVIALTAKGRIAARFLELRAALKRLIKQTPALWNAAKWLRGQLLRLSGRP